MIWISDKIVLDTDKGTEAYDLEPHKASLIEFFVEIVNSWECISMMVYRIACRITQIFARTTQHRSVFRTKSMKPYDKAFFAKMVNG